MNSKVLWVDRDNFVRFGIDRILETDILLDIGCGIIPHDYITPKVYICCEPYYEYVGVLKDKIKNNMDSLFIVLNYDWETVINKFGEKSVDTIFLIDVIEHLEKKTGERLLKLTERVARKQIIIFTPLGFVQQHTLSDGRDAWGLNGAEWQEHKSGWYPEDFDDTWEIVACKDYHQFNNIGEKLSEPFGAFWAIKNIKSFDEFTRDDNLLSIMLEQVKNNFAIQKQKIAKLEQEKINRN